MKFVLSILILPFFASVVSAGSIDANSFKGKAVLVTGASSGIGRTITETLAAKGVYVYAGARKKGDLEALTALENVQGIRLDVTKADEISAAVDLVKSQGRGLHGIVNNAGVFLYAPLIEISESDMDFIMDVNVFGPYRVTKAFAPLIIDGKGRVTTIGSVAGLNSGRMFGPYSMTKFAMEAFTDALAGEMGKFDVQVSIVEPGNFNSNIMKNMHKRQAKLKANGDTSLFDEEYEKMENFSKADRSSHRSPDAVADAVVHALFAEEPKLRYLVTPNQREADRALRGLMRKVSQVNNGHEYSLTNDQLKSLLDQFQK